MTIPITTNRTISAWVYTQNGDTRPRSLLGLSCRLIAAIVPVDARADRRRRVDERVCAATMRAVTRSANASALSISRP